MVSNDFNVKYSVPMQALDGELIRPSVENTRIASRVNASDESAYKLPLMAALWYGLNKTADSFNRSCRGDMDKSLLGRAGNFGDRTTDFIKGTAPGRLLLKVKNGISAGVDTLANKSKVVYALKHTPTSPEWTFAKVPANGLNGFLTLDIKSLFEDYLKPIKSPIALEQYGVKKDVIDNISSTVKSMSAADRAKFLQTEELKVLGMTQERIDKIFAKRRTTGLADMARRLKIGKLGFNNSKDYAKWTKDTFRNKELLYNALNKADDKLNISIWRRGKLFGSEKLGALWSNLWGRQVNMTELRNKLAVVMNKSNAKSTLGRSIQKGMGWLLEGTTGRFGGGKLIPIAMSVPIADSIISTIKAPKGEHIKTFFDRTVNDFSYVFALPVGVMAMHTIGGLANAGNSKAQVKAYEDALAKFKADVKAKPFGSKKDYNKAWENVKKLKPQTKGLTKLFGKIGEFITIGNRTKPAYQSAEKFNLNILRKIPNFLKNCVGVPLRIWIAMALIGGFVSKVCTKGAHTIFGRPTKSVLDEEAEEIADVLSQNTNPFENSITHQSETNLLNMYQNGQKYKTQSNTVKNNETLTNDTKSDGKVLEPVRTYVPSPEGVKVQGEDGTEAMEAVLRSQAAERKAMETLAMKW